MQVESKPEEIAAGDQTPAHGDTFVQASIGDIAGLIPNITSDAASHDVGNLIYDGLVRTDKDLNWVGQMAESWEFSPDCLTLTMKLRRGREVARRPPVHRGRREVHVPGDDQSQDADARTRTISSPSRTCEIVDPYTVRVTYPRPHAKALQSWGMAMLPKHLLEKWVADGKLKRRAAEQPADRDGRVSGSRSGRAARRSCSSPTRTTTRAAPYLGRVVYRIIPSQATIFLELKAKRVDLAGLTAHPVPAADRVSGVPEGLSPKYRYLVDGYAYSRVQPAGSALPDKRVRQAIAHAINKQELIDGVLLGWPARRSGPLQARDVVRIKTT